MPSTTFVTMDGATLVFAATAAELPATPDATATCQVISAAVVPSAQTESTPATLCSATTSRVTGIDYALNVTYFQDWTDAAGFAWWMDGVAGQDQAFLLTLPLAGSVKGTVQVVPGDYGGAAGSSLQATVTMPVRDRIATPPTLVAAASSADDDADDGAELAPA